MVAIPPLFLAIHVLGIKKPLLSMDLECTAAPPKLGLYDIKRRTPPFFEAGRALKFYCSGGSSNILQGCFPSDAHAWLGGREGTGGRHFLRRCPTLKFHQGGAGQADSLRFCAILIACMGGLGRRDSLTFLFRYMRSFILRWLCQGAVYYARHPQNRMYMRSEKYFPVCSRGRG